MAYTVPEVVQTEVYAGDFLTWKKSLSDYPATLWTLSYTLVGANGAYSFSASASGTDHLVEVAITTTDDWVAGDYLLTEYITEISSSKRYTLGTYQFVIYADQTAETATDKRSWARQALDAIKLILKDSNKIAQKKYSIAGRDIEWRNADELMKLYSFYSAEVASEDLKEKANNGVSTGGRFLQRL